MSSETTKPISDRSEPPADLSRLDEIRLHAAVEVDATEKATVKPTPVSAPGREVLSDKVLPFATFEHGYLWSNVLFAEQKAAFIFAADSAFIGYLTAKGVLTRIASNPYSWDLKSYLAALAVAALGFSVASIIGVVMPRVTGDPSGLVFWGAVAKQADRKGYVDSVTNLRDSELGVEALEHCHELARIVRAKYRGIRFAMIFGLLGFVVGLAYTQLP